MFFEDFKSAEQLIERAEVYRLLFEKRIGESTTMKIEWGKKQQNYPTQRDLTSDELERFYSERSLVKN